MLYPSLSHIKRNLNSTNSAVSFMSHVKINRYIGPTVGKTLVDRNKPLHILFSRFCRNSYVQHLYGIKVTNKMAVVFSLVCKTLTN